MTYNRKIIRGLPGLLLAAAAIPATAQETVVPPTITPAPPPTAAPAPTPAPAPASPTIEFAPPAPVVQTAPPPAPPPESVRNPAPEPGAERATRRPAAPAPRAAPAARAAAAAPAAAPAAADPVPVAETPVETQAPAPVPVVEEVVTDPAAATPAPAETEEVSSGAAWAILGLALAAIVGLVAFLILRRRKRSDADMFDHDETAIEPEAQPVIVPPMVAAAPLVPETLAVVDQDVARPWIDIGLRPIRAESDGALDVEVTVSNSGELKANDVRVSTWMLNAGASDGEQALIDARSDAQVATVDVAPGAEQAVDTRVNLPEGTASPLLVAEARYPLPSGGEGRIAATFEIAVGDETPEARLHDVLERA